MGQSVEVADLQPGLCQMDFLPAIVGSINQGHFQFARRVSTFFRMRTVDTQEQQILDGFTLVQQ